MSAGLPSPQLIEIVQSDEFAGSPPVTSVATVPLNVWPLLCAGIEGSRISGSPVAACDTAGNAAGNASATPIARVLSA